MSAVKIGHGIFTWSREERVSNRYGAFFLDKVSYTGEGTCTPHLDYVAMNKLANGMRRTRIVCEVVESRKSGHCGDHFLKVYPTQPAVGERVEIGVGDFSYSFVEDEYNIALVPEDGRAELWLDPRLLYRLHDQTVNVWAEETSDPPHAAPVIEQVEPDGALGADDQGGIQCKRVRVEDVRVKPDFKRIGDGMFIMTPAKIEPGKRLEVEATAAEWEPTHVIMADGQTYVVMLTDKFKAGCGFAWALDELKEHIDGICEVEPAWRCVAGEWRWRNRVGSHDCVRVYPIAQGTRTAHGIVDQKRVYSATVEHHVRALSIAREMISRSMWFAVDPLPDGRVEITVKEECAAWLRERV